MRVTRWEAESEKGGYSKELLVEEVSYISKKQCKKRYENKLNKYVVCAVNNANKAALSHGDNGVPMMFTCGAEDILIGLGLIGSRVLEDKPSQFLKVEPFLEWINTILYFQPKDEGSSDVQFPPRVRYDES